MKIGADRYIATDDDKDWATHHARSLDLIICTVSSPNMPLEQYLMLLQTNGTFIQVGAPEDRLPAFNAFSLIAKGCKIGGSAIGAPHEIEEMLELTAKKGVKPWIQMVPMKEANKAVVDMVRTSPAHNALFKLIGSTETLSRDSRAPPEITMLTWRNTTGCRKS